MDPHTPLRELKGVGEKTAALLKKRDLYEVGDLLTYYPGTYEHFRQPKNLADCIPGETVTLQLRLLSGGRPVRAGSRTIVHMQGADATGQIRLTWFNQPYIARNLPPGSVRLFHGRVQQLKNKTWVMEQPKSFTKEEYDQLANSLQPVYSLPLHFKKKLFLRMMAQTLEGCPLPPEYLTDREKNVLQSRFGLSLMEEEEAIRQIHFPSDTEKVRAARERLVFDEFYLFLAAVHLQKGENERRTNPCPMKKSGETDRFIAALPYILTEGQKAAWKEIEEDLTGPCVMNRLLEGDVGSGKTILAFLALLLCAVNGRQGALMAPTEVLAAQHMETMLSMKKAYDLPVHPVLLTGSVKGKARREALEAIRSGEADVIIGTHALIQEKVTYHNLGLAITDEQHRFGVRQRESLAGKGEELPVLVMSATPIPRTLAIILYGDLQVSLLKERPKDRLPIKNCALPARERERAWRFIAGEVKKGRQAYVICPAIEESEEGENGAQEEEQTGRPRAILEESYPLEAEKAPMANVKETTEKIRRYLGNTLRVEALHGRMKPAQKEEIMQRFGTGEIDVLVSTTVVEVGINVPNATVMVIENAERFGLAQLHQLRGRIGRGKEQSYCIFLYESSSPEKPKRLEILEKNNDGFSIAQQDLALRGPGDLFGVRQSGALGFVLGDIYQDAGLLQTASALLADAVKSDRQLSLPEHETLRRRVAEEAKSVDFRSI